MSKRSAKDYRRSRERLELADFGGEESMVLTLAAAEDVLFEDEGKPRKSLVLTFEEFDGKSFFTNETQVTYLIEMLGDDDEDWIGEMIPIERHVGKFRGKEFEKLWVAAPERWPTLLKGVKRGKAKGKASGK
jgi:hypothetical protein